MNIVFIIGIFLSIFLHILLFSKKKKTTSDRILGVWLLVIGIHLFSYYIYYLGYWEKYPHLVGITHPFPLLHGPLLYLYVVFSIRREQHFRKKDFLHFVPAIASYLYMIPYFFTYSATEKNLMNHGTLTDYQLFMMLSLVAFIVSGILYAFFSFRLIGKFERLIHTNFSFDEGISLNWLRYCIFGIGVVFATVAVSSVIQYILKIPVPFNPDYIYYGEIVLFIFFLGYKGIRHEGIFADTQNEPLTMAEDEMGGRKNGEYKKSGLKTDEAELLHETLLQVMHTKKPYLEPKLTLNALANELETSVNYLSQIINQYEKMNFFDFVNKYRVEDFKMRISSLQNKHLNILAVAYDSGFNSKSSFNMVFKKHTGKTPSQFMAENSR